VVSWDIIECFAAIRGFIKLGKVWLQRSGVSGILTFKTIKVAVIFLNK
jgi:hypothetical protein